jgi:hypothetical protein
MIWTQAQIDKLRTHRAECLTFEEVGRRIPCSRDHALTMAHVLGITTQVTPPKRPRRPPLHKLQPWNPPDPLDPYHPIDSRDLEILDRLVAGESLADAAFAFLLPTSYVRELWRIRELQQLPIEGTP